MINSISTRPSWQVLQETSSVPPSPPVCDGAAHHAAIAHPPMCLHRPHHLKTGLQTPHGGATYQYLCSLRPSTFRTGCVVMSAKCLGVFAIPIHAHVCAAQQV